MFQIAANLAVLDADGVLLDYHQGYARAWKKAFGRTPRVIDDRAYHAHHRFDVEQLEGQAYEDFKRIGFDEDTWSTMPALEGAVEATLLLRGAGMRIICVSALPAEFAQARLRNLLDLGMPIDGVVGTGYASNGENPKAPYLQQMRPALFVDDYWLYHKDVPAGTFKALVDSGAHGSPNLHADPAVAIDGRYKSLLHATEEFLRNRKSAA